MTETIEYKLGKIDEKIESLVASIEDEKEMRKENHQTLNEINERGIRVEQNYENATKRWDSWKDGQTLYMHKNTEDVQILQKEQQNQEKKLEIFKETTNDRIKPLELDLESRNKEKEKERNRKLDIWDAVLKWIIIGILTILIVGFLINIRSFYHTAINFFQ